MARVKQAKKKKTSAEISTPLGTLIRKMDQITESKGSGSCAAVWKN